ncbi:MAG: TlpA family protein disulfide reductase [Verrucomicrobiia bacterium]
MRRILFLILITLALIGPARGEDLSQYKTADELWNHLQTLENTPPVNDRAQYLQQLGSLQSALLEFETRFGSDPRRWDAKLLRVQVESMRARVEGRPADNAASLRVARDIVSATDASSSTKTEARFLIAKTHLEALARSGKSMDPAARAEVEADIAQLRKDYPDDQRTAVLQLELALFLEQRDPSAAETMLRTLEASQDIHVAAVAQQHLASFESTRQLAKAPLDLKFKAVDGTDVDVAKLRGKVVLVDFWATWCGPCRMEIPNVVATYNQLHKDGFEIVGISLDQSKEKLLGYTQRTGMTWPQYFDGKGWANDISSRYGINSIPAAWLVDKKGLVRTTQARGGNLATQVKALLAE